MGEVGSAYAGCRNRITELVSGIDEATAARPVPTCPEWSVHDVVAHASGVVADAMAGKLEGVATDPWTAAQVEARRDVPLSDILAEWDGNAPGFEQLLDAIGDPGRQAVTDLVTHEHDLRLALGRPGARDSDAVHIGLAFVAPALVAAAKGRGASLRIEVDGGTVYGADDADTILTGSAFELLRAMTGRRSPSQLEALQWKGDGAAMVPCFAFGPFRPAAADIDET